MTHRLLTLFIVLIPLSAAALELRFDDAKSDSGETFVFTTVFDEPLTTPPLLANAAPGVSPSYLIWVDPERVERSRFGFFRYVVHARMKADPLKFTQFTIQGKPAGGFDDQIVRVRFTIGEGEPLEEGSVDVPIFGSGAPDAVTAKLPEGAAQPSEIELASDKDIPFTLTNELSGMPVAVTAVTAGGGDGLWKVLEVRTASGPFTPFDLQPGQTVSGVLLLRLRPSAAAVASALIHGKAKEDDVVTVTVTYKTPARPPGSTTLPVRVQFVPWPPQLLPVTLAGAVIGWLIPIAARPKRHDLRERLRILAAAATTGLVIEIVGMLLFIGDSELRILGIALDPFQMLTALLIGFLAGLSGVKCRRFLQNLVKRPFWKLGKAETDNA